MKTANILSTIGIVALLSLSGCAKKNTASNSDIPQGERTISVYVLGASAQNQVHSFPDLVAVVLEEGKEQPFFARARSYSANVASAMAIIEYRNHTPNLSGMIELTGKEGDEQRNKGYFMMSKLKYKNLEVKF